jgi:ADP-ribose pyrophosphatase
MQERSIESEHLYKGKILNLRKDKVVLNDGKTAYREIIEHAPAVVIIPFEKPNKIYLVKQYRKAIEQVVTEVPAGVIDKDEDTLVAAKRELQEETGLIASSWTELGASYPSPGYCTEKMHFFLAQDLKLSEPNPDEDEFIEVISVTPEQMEIMIDKKQIIDSKTILAYLLMKKHI